MSLEEQFAALTCEQVEAFVADGREEGLHLDFKRAERPDMSPNDRRNLATAISGFSNSDGGIIVWGVDARRDASEIDRAVATFPIDPVALFISRLNQITGDAVSPTVDGVVHRVIEKTGTSGYAATLVPRSESAPHMAKCREDRYFKRAGSSFVRLEHFDLDDMFGRRPHPSLDVLLRVRPGGDPGRGWPYRIAIEISNLGRAAARAPLIELSLLPPWSVYKYGVDGNRGEPLPRLPMPPEDGRSTVRWAGAGDFVLHSGSKLEIGAVVCPDANPNAMPSDLAGWIAIAAENAPLRTFPIRLRQSEIGTMSLSGGEVSITDPRLREA